MEMSDMRRKFRLLSSRKYIFRSGTLSEARELKMDFKPNFIPENPISQCNLWKQHKQVNKRPTKELAFFCSW